MFVKARHVFVINCSYHKAALIAMTPLYCRLFENPAEIICAPSEKYYVFQRLSLRREAFTPFRVAAST